MASGKYLGLKGDAWYKARMQALVRDDFCCQAYRLGISDIPCSEMRLRELHVHHIRMRIHGGSHDLDNLITLCKTHHETLHPWMKNSFSKKMIIFTKTLREL
jgi:5-methylcytosine-specific restriction endonuclease McrA